MKKSISQVLSTLTYLEDRKPEMAFTGGAGAAFAEVAPIRDGAIYVGHYSGNSEWERHDAGDELVLVLEGTTTVVLRTGSREEPINLAALELVVVPAGVWHCFKNSRNLKVLTVTPQPTQHSLAPDV